MIFPISALGCTRTHSTRLWKRVSVACGLRRRRRSRRDALSSRSLVSLFLCTRVKSFAGTESLVSTATTTAKTATAMEKMAPLCKIFPHLGFHFQRERERERDGVRVTAWNELRSERMANPTPEATPRQRARHAGSLATHAFRGSLCQSPRFEGDRVRPELELTAAQTYRYILMNAWRALGPEEEKEERKKGKSMCPLPLLPQKSVRPRCRISKLT